MEERSMQKAYLEQMARLLVSIVRNIFLTQVSTVATYAGNSLEANKKDAGKAALTAVDDFCGFSLPNTIDSFRKELESIISEACADPTMKSIADYMEKLDAFLEKGLDIDISDSDRMDQNLAMAALKVLFMGDVPVTRIRDAKGIPSSRGNARPLSAAIQQVFVESYLPTPGPESKEDDDEEVEAILARLKVRE
jgi:hypothetical protein